ncbi:hypothetical protein EDB19DRAFT_1976150 [Suillus lakei]|nr:hypothetical protein EDB19DRAFT_1976150 [Suillus lakei]
MVISSAPKDDSVGSGSSLSPASKAYSVQDSLPKTTLVAPLASYTLVPPSNSSGTNNDVLIDTVFEPTPSNDFPGLYIEYNVPSSPFLHCADSIHIVFQSVWRSPTKSSSSMPTQAQSDQHDTHEWKVLDGVCHKGAQQPNTTHNTHCFPLTETFVIQSETSTNGALKPACDYTAYSVDYCICSGLVLEGCPFPRLPNVLLTPHPTDTLNIPNYTDSVCFGQTHTQKLLIHCGSMDVEDVVASVELLRRDVSEEGRQVVMGGVMEGPQRP